MARTSAAMFLIIFDLYLCHFGGEASENIKFTVHPWELTEDYISAGQPSIRLINGNPYEMKSDESLYTNTSAIYGSYSWMRFFSLGVDSVRELTYIHEYVSSTIYVATSSDFSDSGVFHVGITGSLFNRIAIDWISDVIYWTDVPNQWVCMKPGFSQQPDSAQYKVLSCSESEIPHGIALDPIVGYLFWSDIGDTKKIVRTTLAGTDKLAIITSGLQAPISLTVDIAENKLYWIEAETIECADYSGENRDVIKRRTNFNFFDIAIFKDILIVTELNQGYVYFYNKSTGIDEVQFFNNTNIEKYYNVAMNSLKTQPNVTNLCVEKGCADICVAGATSPTCLCREGMKVDADGLSCIDDGGTFCRALVIANTTHICILDIRSLTAGHMFHVQECLYEQTTSEVLDNAIQFIDLDMIERKIIFATKRTINTVSLLKDHHTILATAEDITSIAYDWSERKIYWTQGQGHGSIILYSFQTQTSKRLIEDILYPSDLVLLPQDGVIMWISGPGGSRQIEKCNTDGSGRTVLVPYSHSFPFPLSLTADRIGKSLFWINHDTIWMCNNDGSDVRSINRSYTILPKHVEVYKTHVVLSGTVENASTIRVVDKRPSHPVTNLLEQNFGDVIGIRVLDEILQQSYQGPCEEQNGGCEHVCLVTGLSRRCECEYGYQLSLDMMSCYSEPFYNDFILVSDQTNSRIYQVSLTNNEVQGLSTGRLEGPTGVVYNHVTNHVIWGEQLSGNIKTSHLNGGNDKILFELGFQSSYPERFAMDYHSGNIYFTFAPASQNGLAGIGVLSPAGKFKTIIDRLEHPQDIAIDPEPGVMFWTDMGKESRHLKKSYMDGTSASVLLSNVTWPRGLALDTKLRLVYIIDGFYDELYQCYYTGGCQMIYRNPYEWPVDLDLLGNYLYYTSWNHQYITQVNRDNFSDITRVGPDAKLGHLYAMFIYSTSAESQTVHQGCHGNRGLGPCSTLCLPKMSGYTCACENGVSLLSDGVTCENLLTTVATTEQVTSSDEHKGTSTATIIAGGLAGGIVFLILIVALLACLLCRKKRGKDQSQSYQDRPDDGYLNPQYLNRTAVSVIGTDDSSPTYDEIPDVVRYVQDRNASRMMASGSLHGSTNNLFGDSASEKSSTRSTRNKSQAVDLRFGNQSGKSSLSSFLLQPHDVMGRKLSSSTHPSSDYLMPSLSSSNMSLDRTRSSNRSEYTIGRPLA